MKERQAGGDAVIEQVMTALAQHDDDLLLLVLGLDGVLAEYQDDPQAVELDGRVRQLLGALARDARTTLAFVSGRRVDDLRARCAVDADAFYVGLHGLEVEGPDFVATDHRAFAQYRDRINDIADAVAPYLGPVAGIRVENKETAIAVHTREARSADAVWARLHLLNAAADMVNNAELRTRRGDHVLELLPNVRASRATATRDVRECVMRRTGKQVFSVIVCEDAPDDDAAAALEGSGMSLCVGRRAKGRLHLASPADVHHLLLRLAAVRLAPAPSMRRDS